MDDCPCKGCPERHEACHGHCERYKTWVQPIMEDRKRREIFQTIKQNLDDPQQKAMRKRLNERKRHGR